MPYSGHQRSDKEAKSSIKKVSNAPQEELISQKDDVEQVSAHLQIGSVSESAQPPMTAKTVLSMQSVLGNSATNRLLNGNGAQVQRRTPSTPFSNFGLKTASEFTESEELQSETDEVRSPEIKQTSEAPADIPPNANPFGNGSGANNPNQSQNKLGRVTSKIIAQRKTPSTPFSNFGLQTAPEYTESEELQSETDEVRSPEIKQSADASADNPPNSNPSDNGSDENNSQPSQIISNNAPHAVQRGFMSSIKKGASSVGSAVKETASGATTGLGDVVGDTVGAAGKGLVTAGKAVGAGLQGGVMAAAKILLGPFWDLIVAVRDKKDGEPVSFWGKENEEYVNMLKEGQNDPYGGGVDGKFATGLSFVANGILTKLATWAGWASLWAGIIGLAGSGVGLAPLLGVSQFLGQIATYAGAASAGLNLILGIFSALRANRLFGALKDPIDTKDEGQKTGLEAYLMVNKELQTNAGGVATGLGDAVLAGAGGAIGGSAKGTKQANKAKKGMGALDGDAIGATAGAKKGLKDTYDPRNFKKAKNNATGNYKNNKVRTSKAEAKLKNQIADYEDANVFVKQKPKYDINAPDAPVRSPDAPDMLPTGGNTPDVPNSAPNRATGSAPDDPRFVNQEPAFDINAPDAPVTSPDAPDMLPTGGSNAPDAPTKSKPSNTIDDAPQDGDLLSAEEYKAAKQHHRETGFTDKEAGQMRNATMDDAWGEVGVTVGAKAGGKVAGGVADYGGRSASEKDAGEVTGDTGVEWTNTKDHKTGYAQYAADDSEDGTIVDKKKLPTVGDAVTKGFADGFLPFTILGGLWKVIYKAYELLASLMQPFLDKIGSLAEPMAKIGFPAALITKWVLKGYKAFGTVLSKVNGIIVTILSFGTQAKEDTEKKD